jgi:hypothetical protein
MSLVHTLVTVVKSHPQTTTAVALWLVATLKTLFTKRPTVESGLDLLAEILGSGSYKGEKGQVGRLTLPVLGRSRTVSTQSGKVNMLPILFAGMLATIPACAALKALGVCELGALPQTTQGAIACALSVANNSTAPGGSTQAALTACVASLGPEQASCVMQAVMSFLKGQVPAHGQASEQTLIAISRVRAYLDAHPVTK